MVQTSVTSNFTVTGMLLGRDFTRNGKLIELALETEDFDQYIISQDHKGKELFSLLYANVTVKGKALGIDPEGNVILQVNEYVINDRYDPGS